MARQLLWTLTRDARTLRCEARPQPRRHEMVLFDEDTLVSFQIVHSDVERRALLQAWRSAAELEGWMARE